MIRTTSNLCPLFLLLPLACSQGSTERGIEGADPGSGTEAADPETLPDTVPFEQTPVGRHGRLSVEGTLLVDEAGDPLQLRGVSSMWLNWETTGYARNYGAMQWMRDNWGITVFRAAMGIKDGERAAASGGYLTNPTTMENQVDDIIQNATDLGVYILIDWHDHFAQDSVEEAKDFFRRKAAQHRNNPSVIYEVFNEPVPREWATGEEFTWEDHFKPYHEELVETIRSEDPEGVIILGTPFWSQNVDEAAMDPVIGSNLMYTLHFYSCTHDAWLRDKAQVALDAGLPLFVTEWGATDAGGGVDDTTVCDEEADLWHDFMDANYIGWAAWKLDDCAEGSCLLGPGAPRGGGWDAQWLQGHGPYVVEKLLAPLPDGPVARPSVPSSEQPDAGEPVLAGDARAEAAGADRPEAVPDAGVSADVDGPNTPRDAAAPSAAVGQDASASDPMPTKPRPDAAAVVQPDATPEKVP